MSSSVGRAKRIFWIAVPRGSVAEGDLYTALPTETNSPLTGRPALAGRKSAGAELAADA
jgi:hypothetical protein